MSLRERFITDEEGNRVSVVLDMKEYRKILEELEELESIRTYDVAKEVDDGTIPFEQAVEEIEQEH